MRYYYEKFETKMYNCDHPLYDTCTLYYKDDKGLAVVQQRYNSKMKIAYWSCIDSWLIYDICNREGFAEYFAQNSSEPDTDGLYPTVTVRKLMNALKMKPLRKNIWEHGI